MDTIFTFALDSMPLNNDSHWPTDYDARFVAEAVLRTLYTEDHRAGSIVPSAALAIEGLADGRRWRVHLDPTLRWSDGLPLTAADALRSAERAVNHPRAGLSGLLGGSGPAGPARPIDEATIEYHFQRPVSFAPALFTLPQLAPARPGGTGYDAPSLGEYRVTAATGNALSLRRHPFGVSADPVADQLRFTSFADVDSALLAFDRGAVDVSPTTSFGIPELARYVEHPGLFARDVAIFGNLEFGVRSGALRDSADLRSALGRALDRARLGTALGGLVRPMYGHTRAWMPEDTGPPVTEPGTLTGSQVDRIRASLGEGVDLRYADFTPNGAVVEELCRQLTALLDITVVPRAMSYPQYVRAVLRDDHALLYTLTTAEFPHPAALLLPWRTDGGQARRSGFSDPGLDDLFDAACAHPEADGGDRMWVAADERWLQLMPRVPLLQVRSHSVHQPRIGGFHLTSAGLVAFHRLMTGASGPVPGRDRKARTS